MTHTSTPARQMRARRVHSAKFALLAALAGVLLFTLPGFADSQVRIVRLSDVQGDVRIDRHVGQGFERAVLNMPVTQAMILSTGNDGRAEVEFENGTVVRLGPASQLDFQRLGLLPSGAKVSTIDIDHGVAYFDFKHKGDDVLSVVFAGREIPVDRSAHFRVEVAQQDVKLAVFSGELWIRQGGEQIKIAKGEELTLDLAANSNYLAKNISPEEYDQWDKERSKYEERYSSSSDYSSYPYYGRGDLNYYGDWSYIPGYGQLWQPYNVGYGWSPFGSGYWCWYPGFGYTWVSSYPWGWLPYRYGSWTWVPGWGWGWMPGPYWTAWAPVPRIVNPPTGFVRPVPPDSPHHPTVIVRNTPPNQPVAPRIPAPDVRVRGAISAPAKPPVVSTTTSIDTARRSAPPSVSRTPSRPVVSGPARSSAPSVSQPHSTGSPGSFAHSGGSSGAAHTSGSGGGRPPK